MESNHRPQSSGLLSILLVVLLPLAFAGTIGCRKNSRIPPLTEVTESTLNPLNDPTAVAEGKKMFLRNCAICHGHLGEGDGPSRSTLLAEPANLRIAPAAALSDGRMFRSIRLGKMVDGRYTMPPVEKMTDQQVWQTIAYVRTLAAR
jgi:mono/diheme cytochrome c family protein